MKAAVVRVEQKDQVAIVTLARQERMNALSEDMLLELGAIGRQLTGDGRLRAIVLTGAGDKAFCAGADLKERQGMTESAVHERMKLYASELSWIDCAKVPVIAAINGVALGGGLELALLCDLRVAAEHAFLGLPETSLGIIPGSGGTQRLPRIVGEARAKELILLATRLSADDALRIGLVNRVTRAGTDVLEDTLAFIRPISEGAPIAQRAALRAIDAALQMPLEQGLELERTLYDDCLRSEDRVEALRAFAEKRKPIFKGS